MKKKRKNTHKRRVSNEDGKRFDARMSRCGPHCLLSINDSMQSFVQAKNTGALRAQATAPNGPFKIFNFDNAQNNNNICASTENNIH